MRSFNLGFLLLALALSNLAGHRTKEAAGCQCTKSDLEDSILVVPSGVTLNPGESGAVSFRSFSPAGAVIPALWELTFATTTVIQPVAKFETAGEVVSIDVTALPEDEHSKHLEFGTSMPGRQGEICMEAEVPELYSGSRGCARVVVTSPEIDVSPLGRSSGVVQVSNAGAGNWSFTYRVSPPELSKWITVKGTPPVAIDGGVKTSFGAKVDASTPTDDRTSPCLVRFNVIVVATSGDFELENSWVFKVPVTCPN